MTHEVQSAGSISGNSLCPYREVSLICQFVVLLVTNETARSLVRSKRQQNYNKLHQELVGWSYENRLEFCPLSTAAVPIRRAGTLMRSSCRCPVDTIGTNPTCRGKSPDTSPFSTYGFLLDFVSGKFPQESQNYLRAARTHLKTSDCHLCLDLKSVGYTV